MKTKHSSGKSVKAGNKAKKPASMSKTTSKHAKLLGKLGGRPPKNG